MTYSNDKTLNILVANGVNLDLLGKREEDIYGCFDLQYLESYLDKLSKSYLAIFPFKRINLHFYQTNCEAEYLEKISQQWDAVILNPGAWTHTSIALADRLKALRLLFIEVHISNIFQRESFRKVSYCSSSAHAIISGAGHTSYGAALFTILDTLKQG